MQGCPNFRCDSMGVGASGDQCVYYFRSAVPCRQMQRSLMPVASWVDFSSGVYEGDAVKGDGDTLCPLVSGDVLRLEPVSEGVPVSGGGAARADRSGGF